MSVDLLIKNGDYVWDGTGGFEFVQNQDKLEQDVNRMIYTLTGSNRFNQTEGCNILKLLGLTLPQDLLVGVLSKELYFGLQNLIQQQNYQKTYQVVSGTEAIFCVNGIIPQKLDSKRIAFSLVFTTINGALLTLAYNVSKTT